MQEFAFACYLPQHKKPDYGDSVIGLLEFYFPVAIQVAQILTSRSSRSPQGNALRGNLLWIRSDGQQMPKIGTGFVPDFKFAKWNLRSP
ncbi:MAG: hypothetical protein SOX70_01710 [Peptoniphilaceae bacterium]|nr:hypothetical protein [Peptoniphilaceae bacterium]